MNFSFAAIPLRFFIVLLVTLGSSGAGAREQVDLNLELSTTKQGPEAKQDAIDQATEEASRRQTEELLGPEKTAQQWPLIRTKVLKSADRYILFMKGSPPVQEGDHNKVLVQVRLAPDVLEGVLRDLGQFAGGSVQVLPLFQLNESRGSKYVWWADFNEDKAVTSLAQEYFKKCFQDLAQQFKSKSVFVLDPTNASFRLGVPAAYRSESLRREDQALMAQYLKADVVLTGHVDVVRLRSDSLEQRLDFDLQLWQAKSGRMVAEINRSEPIRSDNPKVVTAVIEQAGKRVYLELANKLAEAIGSGNLNLNVMRLAVVGVLNFRQQSEFRKALTEMREVRLLRDRLFEPGRVTYEIETPASGFDLAKALQKNRFPGFNVGVEGAQDDSLVLNVRATSAQ